MPPPSLKTSQNVACLGNLRAKGMHGGGSAASLSFVVRRKGKSSPKSRSRSSARGLSEFFTGHGEHQVTLLRNQAVREVTPGQPMTIIETSCFLPQHPQSLPSSRRAGQSPPALVPNAPHTPYGLLPVVTSALVKSPVFTVSSIHRAEPSAIATMMPPGW